MPVVGDVLDRLENWEVIVSHSDWTTSMIIVRKPGGKVKIYVHFKVTVNPAKQTDVNQMPDPQKLF